MLQAREEISQAALVCLGQDYEMTLADLTDRADCDCDAVGYIDRESFVQGMWRIDEELARRRLVRPMGSRR